MAGAQERSMLCSILFLQVIASAAGGRLLQQTSPQAGALPLTQVELSLSDSFAQLSAKLAYLRTLAAGGSALPTTGVRNFAATTVPIGGTNAPLGGFTVDLKVGTPPVSIPVVVDTFTSITWVQGPDCAPCPGSPPCAEATQIIALNGGQLTCPYSGPLYYPSLSSSAITSFDCATTCASDSGSSFNVGCLNVLGGGPTACQYFSAIGGIGLSAGSLVRDAVSLGSVATLSGSTVFVGTSILEPGKKLNGAGGVAAFSPVAEHSLPFQLRDAGAITTPTFAICLAAGGSNAGSLFVGGVPTQPNSNAPYPLTFAARQTQANVDTDPVLWNVARPTDVLVNGIPVTGASAALAAELQNAFYVLDSGTRFTLLPTAVYNPLFDRLRQFSGCPNVFSNTVGNGVDPIQTHDFIDLTTCTPPLSASPSAEELGARFPPITIVLPGGTRLTATAKAYARTGNFGPNGELALDTGLVSLAGTGLPNDPSRVIGTNFLADNLVVFDVEQNRFGFAPVDCNTLLPLTKTNIPPVTPAPTTPAPTTPAPTTPAPTTPAPTTPAPTTPAPTTPAPTTPAPTTPAPTTPAPTTPAPTTPAPTTPAPTTPAPTTAAPVTPAPSTPAPTTGIFPAGGSCDAYSAFPNQCFNNVGSQFTCCPVGVSCASPPTSTPACVGFDSSSGGPPPTTSAPVTASPTTAAPVTSAPTTAAPVTSAPTTAAPVTSTPTTAAPVTPSPTTPNAPGTTCDPFSALPNQCFNADGSSFICCSGSCPSVPGPVAVCG